MWNGYDRWMRVIWGFLFLLTSGLGVALAQAVSKGPPAGAPCQTIAPADDDGPVISPANHTVLFEDADIRVLDVHSQPHTREAVHTHARPAVMYVDRQGAGTYRTPDGSRDTSHPTDPNFKPRIFAIKPEGLHWTENTGDVAFHAIRVEFKHPGCGLPGWTPAADDGAPPAAETRKVIFDNTDVRVFDAEIPPHTTVAFQAGSAVGFFYVPTISGVRYQSGREDLPGRHALAPSGRILPMMLKGDSIENVGDTPLHAVQYELKFGTATP